jgi:hypothetical protein
VHIPCHSERLALKPRAENKSQTVDGSHSGSLAPFQRTDSMFAAKADFIKFIHLKNDSQIDRYSLNKSSSKDVHSKAARFGYGNSTNDTESRNLTITMPTEKIE